VEHKKELKAKIGPGTYINPKEHSEFRPEQKPEYLQFFGTTEERFKNFPVAVGQLGAPPVAPLGTSGSMPDTALKKTDGTSTLPGPGTYNPEKPSGGQSLRKVNTAAFQSQRKDLLFSGNAVPGPGQYSTSNKNGGGQHSLKNWQTNIGAFGSTEKRFATQQVLAAGATGVANPGPGEYEVVGINPEQQYVTKRIRGKSMKVRKPDITSGTFKSTTGRLLEDEEKKVLKTQVGAVGQYET
jgi:Sperm-tail PG-rich repeat